VVGLVLGQPAQLGDGERRHRHRPDGRGPGVPAAELGDEVLGGGGGAGVVPEQGVADDLAVLVEADHAVLLAADGDRGHVVQAACVGSRLLDSGPPGGGVDLGAVGVARAAGADQLAGLGVADDDLAGLGRGVDPGDERAAHVPLRSGA
jgi:hypothetical protein